MGKSKGVQYVETEYPDLTENLKKIQETLEELIDTSEAGFASNVKLP